ncbi:MAG: hypothetical protein JSV64_00350 [Candidatus Bathyarchaeota archaeon]|nr:MAG: hypothetical protein JSV64_00350 [Candidatus Bathyarchaeota archaeon]
MNVDKRGVSYAISAVIMTATIVVLVLVTSVYTYQVLENQRGASEFSVAQKSILAFDDALENIAWKVHGSRSARFNIEYGILELMPNKLLTVNATGFEGAVRSLNTSYVKYSIETRYISLGENYTSYILGDSKLVSNGTGTYGRALVEQRSGWIAVTLSYGVRAMETSTIDVIDGNTTTRVTYVDIWIIEVDVDEWSAHISDFDLKARCLEVQTHPTSVYPVDEENRLINITVQLDGESDSTIIQLDDDAESVVFNFVIATVQLTI